MHTQKKPARGRALGGACVTSTSKINRDNSEYTTVPPTLQYNRALGDLLDQAITRFEHHLALAHHHATEARKHRKVLRSLQSLIPTSGGRL